MANVDEGFRSPITLIDQSPQSGFVGNEEYIYYKYSISVPTGGNSPPTDIKFTMTPIGIENHWRLWRHFLSLSFILILIYCFAGTLFICLFVYFTDDGDADMFLLIEPKGNLTEPGMVSEFCKPISNIW